MRLRPLTEAECYARCYGDIRSDQVVVIGLAPAGDDAPVTRAPDPERLAELREEAA